MNEGKRVEKWPVGLSFSDRLVLFGATAGFLGRIPYAPGTWGSLPAIPLAHAAHALPPAGEASAIVLLCLGAVYLAGRAGRLLGREDASPIVVDEVAGMAVALAFTDTSLFVVLRAFVLFRLLDITKPFGIGWVEKRVSGGIGVVADDILAGISANLLGRIWDMVTQNAW